IYYLNLKQVLSRFCFVLIQFVGYCDCNHSCCKYLYNTNVLNWDVNTFKNK
ncbi:hypothetical protein M5D96_010989, partial [Drosophila gunungcola]